MKNSPVLKITNGWVEQVKQITSPNYNHRPANTIIDSIIIHGISLPPGKFGGSYISDFFTNQLDIKQNSFFQQIKNLKVSAHFLIQRKGQLIQYVNTNYCAWHAGKSSLAGRSDCNDFSIGIELEGVNDQAYEEQQYTQLAVLVNLLQSHYPAITQQRIVGHSDIAPGRKTDPGKAFDWEYFFMLKDKYEI